MTSNVNAVSRKRFSHIERHPQRSSFPRAEKALQRETSALEIARAAIPVGERTAMFVPETAVVHEGQLTAVFVVDKGGKARIRLIRTGIVDDDRVEVVHGLADGETFVVDPPPKMVNGVAVEAAP